MTTSQSLQKPNIVVCKSPSVQDYVPHLGRYYEIMVIEDIQNLRSTCEQYRPNIVIFDLVDSDQEIFNICRLIPTIAVADNNFYSIVDAIKNGVADILEKPFDLQDLRQTIERHLHIKSSNEHKILIVDDDNGSLRAFARIFLHKNYLLLYAANNFSILEIITNSMIDLIIIDFQELTIEQTYFFNEIKKRNILAHTPMIAVTSNSSLKLPLENLGFAKVMLKPIEREKLITEVGKLLSNQKKMHLTTKLASAL